MQMNKGIPPIVTPSLVPLRDIYFHIILILIFIRIRTLNGI